MIVIINSNKTEREKDLLKFLFLILKSNQPNGGWYFKNTDSFVQYNCKFSLCYHRHRLEGILDWK